MTPTSKPDSGMDTSSENITIAAAGDLLIDRAAPETALAAVRALLGRTDVSVCNFEGVLGEPADALPGRAGIAIAAARNASGVAPFGVASLANNHSMDAGWRGLSSTIEALGGVGCRVVGAGACANEAWAPIIVECGPRSVAFVAASAVLRAGYEASAAGPGVAALRSTDFYASRFPGAIVPGVAPKIHTEVNNEDWRLLEMAIDDAKTRADFVVALMHWGDHTQPFVVTDFERGTARRIGELGVDLIVGHHHHALRGIAYAGRTAILYGLGHLVFDQPASIDRFRTAHPECNGMTDAALEARFGQYAHFPRHTGFLFDETSRWAVIASVSLARGRPPAVLLVPLFLDSSHTPHVIERGTAQWAACLDFWSQCQRAALANARVEDQGMEQHGFAALTVVPES